MNTCLKPGCNKKLKTGRMYCSTTCANQDRPRVKTLSSVPSEIKDVITAAAGDAAPEVMNAMAEVIRLAREDDVIRFDPNAAIRPVKTYGDVTLSWDENQEYRPDDALDYDKIEAMDKSGIVQFALRMRQAQLMLVFKDGNWKVESLDDELSDAFEANLREVLEPMMFGMLDNMLRTGAGICEIPWVNKNKQQLGIAKNRSATLFTVMDHARHVDTSSVWAFRRDKKGRFDGFIQRPRIGRALVKPEKAARNFIGGSADDIVVQRENALVLAFLERNRNKWGISLYETIYPLWFWYQVVLRSMVRYMERMGVPVAVVDAPADRSVIDPGTGDEIDAMQLGLRIAANAGRSNALAIPSNTDRDGNRMWNIRYLSADERAQPFTDVLEKMAVMILRAAFFADRSLTGGEVGAFNLGEIHQAANAILDQMIIMHIVHQFNQHIPPRFAQFNRGVANTPNLRMTVIGVDMRQTDLLFKLLGIGGNIPASQEAMARIDWVGLAENVGVPTISEEERDRQKKKLEEEALDRQQKQIDMQQKAKMSAGEEPFQSNSVKSPAKEAKEKATPNQNGSDKQADLVQQFVDLLLENDLMLPIMVSDEEKIKLFNPFHGRSGRFASGPGGRGGTGSSGGGKSGKEQVALPERRSGGSGPSRISGAKRGSGSMFLKIGAITAVSAIAGGFLLSQASGAGDTPQERAQEETEDWPEPESVEGVQGFINSSLSEMGIDIEGMSIKVEEHSLGAGNHATYDPVEQALYIPPKLMQRAKNGDPDALSVIIHEAEHHGQRDGSSQRPDGIVLDGEDFGQKEADMMISHAEGQNQLMTLATMSKIYGRPVDDDELRSMTITKLRAEGFYGSFQTIKDPYKTEEAAWAGIATVWQSKNGGTRLEFLRDAHDQGFNIPATRSRMAALFPDQMRDFEGNSMPSPNTILGWLRSGYGIDGASEIRGIMEEAAQ